jgi:tRNA(adenine34) deaminase
LAQAIKARDAGEIPIGAVLVFRGEVVACAHNERESSGDPTRHAEIIVIRRAAELKGDWRLDNTCVYVTVEPCPMCLGALLQARIPRLVYGTPDPKRETVALLSSRPHEFCFPSLGEIKTVSGNNHRVEIKGGVMEEECRVLLTDFFKPRRP